MRTLIPKGHQGEVEIWFQDEARVGQKNTLTYLWHRKGQRPRLPQDQRHRSVYLFGALCVSEPKAAALVLPVANTQAMKLHLEEISRQVAPGRHAIIVLDQAAWHTTAKLDIPDNLSLLFLPPKSPELNPVENLWQYLRQNFLANRVFETTEAIIDACCQAWNALVADTKRLSSLAEGRSWIMIENF